MTIRLYNRYRARLYLYRDDESTPIKPEIYEWKMIVDPDHKYILEYCRIIYKEGLDSDIMAIDPSGGPFLPVGQKFQNEKYEIIKINSTKSIWISERINDNQEYIK